MRRTVLLLTLPATLLLPAPSASAACVSSTGITVCPPVHRCGPGSVVTVVITGVAGYGSASCGGATAECIAFRFGCSDVATASSTGVLTCTSSRTVVATCTVSPAAG